MTATTGSPGTLEERVAARADSLSTAEWKVARYLASHPEGVAFASAAELGQLTGTSDATVIRTVKALGYDGLPGLKASLRDNIRERLTPASRLSQRLDAVGGDNPGNMLSQVITGSIELLQEALHTIRPESFAEAVDLIYSARQTLVLGYGGLGILGEYLALRLTRLGHQSHASVASGPQLADDLFHLQKDDVLVLVAYQQVARDFDVALDHAAAVGAKAVLVTDALAEALADRVTVSVSAPIGDTSTFRIQANTLAVLEAIALAVAAKDRDASLAAMTRLNELRNRLRADDDPLNGQGPRIRRRRPASGGEAL